MIENSYHNIHLYFSELGYDDLSIQSSVKINNIYIDMIIYKEQKPYIIVEVKKLKASLMNKNIEFNPYIEELQYKSVITNSPYYVLTDGDSYLWLRTDANGRPELLSQPLIEKKHSSRKLSPKGEFESALQRIKDIYMVDYSIDITLTIIISWLEKKILESEESLSRDVFNKDLHLLNSVNLEVANRIMEKISIENLSPKEFSDSFQSVFGEYKDKKISYTPKWIIELSYKLLGINTQEVRLLEIFNANESILSSIMSEENQDKRNIFFTELQFNEKQDKVKEIYRLFAKIKKMNINSVLLQKDQDLEKILEDQVFDDIFMSFVELDQFIKKNDFKEGEIEEKLLDSVIKSLKVDGRIILLMPDKYLSTRIHKKFRQNILEKMNIRAIISSSDDNWYNHHFVKCSILVLEKLEMPSHYENHILMAEIENKFIFEEKNHLKYSEFYKLWKALESIEEKSIEQSGNIWYINYSELDDRSFLPKRNKDISLGVSIDSDMNHQIVILNEVTLRINRGTKAKINNSGETPLIGPGAIRPMEIRYSEINKTTFQQLPSRVITVMENDIVMNNIGTYTGTAGIVNKNLAGTVLNQNVVLIRANPQKVHPKYLVAVLNSNYVKNQIKKYVNNRGLFSLTNESIQNLKIPLPSLNEQMNIVMKIEKNEKDYLDAMETYKKSKVTYFNSIKNLLQEEEGE